MKRAIISVWDKTGLDSLAPFLAEHGYEIISTGGTAKAIEAAGVPVTAVENLTGQMPLMDGRVKTLDAHIFGPILYDRTKESHRTDLETLGQTGIGLVVVNLYPFAEQLSDRSSRSEMIEYIDIGGPSLLRAAAKNHRHVLVVGSPDQYDTLKDLITEHGDDIPGDARESLAAAAFAQTARYDRAIAEYFAATKGPLPAMLSIGARLTSTLRYGENPHQAAGFYLNPGQPLPWRQLHGRDLSFNNYGDADSAMTMVTAFEQPAAVIVKHANPCGFGIGPSPLEAYTRALATDPVSSFGGIVAFNRLLDAETAALLADIFLECIITPGFEEGALEILSRKKKLRLLSTEGQVAEPMLEVSSTAGGYLVQEADSDQGDQDWKTATQRKPTPTEMEALRLGWKMVRFVKSNAIVFCNDVQLLGVGAGQMSRVDAVALAGVKAGKAKLSLKGAAMASDAFFPFPDGLRVAAELGITSVIQPGGSIRDADVIAAADELGLAMVLTQSRHFRH